MKVGNLLASRPNWYDRNPSAFGFNSVRQAVAPAAPTQRFNYTVPANKKAIVEAGVASICRLTAAGVVGNVGADLTYAFNTGGTAYMPIAWAVNNSLGIMTRADMSLQTLMLAAETITGNDRDESTGGTCTIIISLKLTQYDA